MSDEELNTRVKVAYEQLGRCHTALCRRDVKREDTGTIDDLTDILNSILRFQVKLGFIKREEDL